MNSFSVVFQDVQGAFIQEAMLLMLFGISFSAWRHMRPPRSVVRKPKQIESADDGKAEVLRAKSSPKVFTAEIKEKAKHAEAQMLQLMENNEFTRALNQYRSFERAGQDALFTEELFSAFAHSATRVGKVDVTDRMLRAMKRAGITPSLEFWQHTMKLLSSRKHFGACLSMYDLWPRQCPADKTVLSCIINAALELGMAERARPMLQKYMQADLAAKDHVLFFRCHVLLGDADAAEALFRKLGSQSTPLMLNLTLSILVGQKQTERAYNLLQEAHKLEEGLSQRLVDIVSYNTVMKSLAAAKDKGRLQCVACLRGLVEHDLEPDEITLGVLLDTRWPGAESDTAVANEIGEMLLNCTGQKKKMTSAMMTIFVKGLIRAGSLSKALAVYGEMKKRDASVADVITYSVLIKALVDQHRLDEALELAADMKSRGLGPDDIILTHLLDGCRHTAKHDLGKQLVKEAVESGVQISDVTLVTLMKLHGRCGAHQEAFDLMGNCESLYGVKPSVIHYTCLISGCFRTRSFDKAWESFQLMLASNVEPDVTTLTTILPCIVTSKQWKNVLIAVHSTLKREVVRKPNDGLVESLNHALAQMRASSCPSKLISELQVLMKEAGVAISAKNSNGNL
eukprot:CAMPEP_0197654440 /NCGR_PEP_ID=MMETSP1338-20131121/38850_1 /TAXON_ID=43686 ORGANISM="Pelagodinium beii, Strain RCC1491" /NCGR_SAMPLE_ID=MMETSP1338 /ASSEMBLY_ACC=CAM_ASM_000754 /LENGTH=624 /DNA_ID=CAMNT_0043229883 /DNA_START=144 /DNA_END=2018 /DNA_ORIENTATION=+